MAELGVTQELFLDACQKASTNNLHKKIVDQITAVDNFVAFKKLMVKRNTELNEQAIRMLSGEKDTIAPMMPPPVMTPVPIPTSATNSLSQSQK